MNFQDLLTKIKALDEQSMMPPTDSIDNPEDDPSASFDECGDGDTAPRAVMPKDDLLTDECGGMMPSMSAPKQSDSVTMNVSMNGSGSGGIKDLLDILRNIESSGGNDADDADDVLVGVGTSEDFSDATTRPNPQAVALPDSGDDLHREKEEYRAVAGGGNPMRMRESLVAKLSARYSEIKGQ